MMWFLLMLCPHPLHWVGAPISWLLCRLTTQSCPLSSPSMDQELPHLTGHTSRTHISQLPMTDMGPKRPDPFLKVGPPHGTLHAPELPVGSGWGSSPAETSPLLSSFPCPPWFPHFSPPESTPSTSHFTRIHVSGSVSREPNLRHNLLPMEAGQVGETHNTLADLCKNLSCPSDHIPPSCPSLPFSLKRVSK